jgi:hypothetical protein
MRGGLFDWESPILWVGWAELLKNIPRSGGLVGVVCGDETVLAEVAVLVQILSRGMLPGTGLGDGEVALPGCGLCCCHV